MLRKKLLAVFLSVILLSNSGCTKEPQPEEPGLANVSSLTRTGDAVDHLPMIPGTANMVFYADLQTLRKTPVGEAMRREIELKITDDEGYIDFMKHTGVDIKKDLDQIWAGALAGQNEHLAGAIATGRFDAKRIVTYIRDKNPKIFEQRSYRGHDIYSGKDKDDSITFLNSTTVILGNTKWVDAIVDQIEDKGKNVLDNPEMAKQIAEVSNSGPVWGVVDLSKISGKWAEEIRQRGSVFKGTQSLENMQSLFFYAQINDKVDLFIKGNFTTDEEARLLAEMMNGFKAMAKLMVSDDREAVDMINDIKIKSAGPVLEVSATLDKQFMKKVKEKQKTFSNSPVRLM